MYFNAFDFFCSFYLFLVIIHTFYVTLWIYKKHQMHVHCTAKMYFTHDEHLIDYVDVNVDARMYMCLCIGSNGKREGKMHTENYFGRCLVERVENTWYYTFVCLLQLMMMIIIIKMVAHIERTNRMKGQIKPPKLLKFYIDLCGKQRVNSWNPSPSHQSAKCVCFYISKWAHHSSHIKIFRRKACSRIWTNKM